jgi:hypothetical protein
MPMWVWIMIGVGSFLGLSVLMGFALAWVLGTIGRQIGELYETGDWAMLPPTRAARDVKEKDVNEEHPEEAKAMSSRVDRPMQHR